MSMETFHHGKQSDWSSTIYPDLLPMTYPDSVLPITLSLTCL